MFLCDFLLSSEKVYGLQKFWCILRSNESRVYCHSFTSDNALIVLMYKKGRLVRFEPKVRTFFH